jgi:hypothetical protein
MKGEGKGMEISKLISSRITVWLVAFSQSKACIVRVLLIRLEVTIRKQTCLEDVIKGDVFFTSEIDSSFHSWQGHSRELSLSAQRSNLRFDDGFPTYTYEETFKLFWSPQLCLDPSFYVFRREQTDLTRA